MFLVPPSEIGWVVSLLLLLLLIEALDASLDGMDLNLELFDGIFFFLFGVG